MYVCVMKYYKRTYKSPYCYQKCKVLVPIKLNRYFAPMTEHQNNSTYRGTVNNID